MAPGARRAPHRLFELQVTLCGEILLARPVVVGREDIHEMHRAVRGLQLSIELPLRQSMVLRIAEIYDMIAVALITAVCAGRVVACQVRSRHRLIEEIAAEEHPFVLELVSARLATLQAVWIRKVRRVRLHARQPVHVPVE
jgi:hypothetical protein